MEERPNQGKTYREYLAEAYGSYKAKRLLNPHTQSIIEGLKRRNERLEEENPDSI